MRAHLGFSALLLLGSACSVINAYDDVSEIAAASTGGKSSGSGGSNMGGGGGSDSGGSSSGGMGGSGTGGTAMVAEPGLIVVRGTDVDLSPVLSVLSPQTGEELAREDLSAGSNFEAHAHDPDTDTWYVVKYVDTTNKYTLEARTFDRLDNEWTVLGTPVEVPRVLPRGILVLSDRLVLLTSADNVQAELHAFDTSDPSDITEAGTALALGAKTAVKGAVAQKTTLGGTVMVARSGVCTADMIQSCISLLNVIVAAEPSAPFAPKDVTPVPDVGSVVFGFDTVDDRVLLATPTFSSGTVSGGNLLMFGPDQAHAPLGSPTFFSGPTDAATATLSGIAFDPCNQIAFVDGLDLNDAKAIPLRPSMPDVVSKPHPSHPGPNLEFEQETRTLLVYYSLANDYKIVGYKVGGTDEAPTFVTRTSDWDPPNDLRPSGVVAATPKKPCTK